MDSFVYVLIWVLPSVLIAVGVGYYLGRPTKDDSPPPVADDPAPDRAQLLQVLGTLVTSAEKLTSDVDSHNHELEDVGRSVGEITASGELAQAQTTLLDQITRVLQCNRKLESDLCCTRYKLEQQAQELDRTRKEARTDPLSGVGNRKAFDEHFQFLLSQYNSEGSPFVLVLLDVDKFKWINDTHGHQAGDRVVRQLGSLLCECVRGSDFVARYGGDEFAVLFSDLDAATAYQVTDRIRIILERESFDCGSGCERVSATCSMGLAEVQPGDTVDSLFERADRALYKSKSTGRNQVSVEPVVAQ